jgi:hypothetical protein
MDFVFDVNTPTIKHAIQEDLALTLDNFNSTTGNLTTLVSKFTIVLGNFTTVLENFIVWVRNFINGYITSQLAISQPAVGNFVLPPFADHTLYFHWTWFDGSRTIHMSPPAQFSTILVAAHKKHVCPSQHTCLPPTCSTLLMSSYQRLDGDPMNFTSGAVVKLPNDVTKLLTDVANLPTTVCSSLTM